MSLAYKYVALAVMMAEINYCANQLHLKEKLPIKEEDATMSNIFDPSIMGFAGRIDTAEYSFCFSKSGRLRFITKLEDYRYQSMGLYRGNQSTREFMEQLSQIKSTINTNDAYRLATNWLASIDVDLEKLQQEKPATVEQQFFESSKGPVPVPLFYVNWGKEGRDELGHPMGPVVDIMVSGINGELLNLRQEDDSYSKRPAALIKDMDKLLAIPDAEFLKYSPEELSNLVTRFSTVKYFQTNTVAQTHAPNNQP